MPEVTEQPTKPLRTWRPMVFWTAGILLALGLVWFVAAVVVPVWQVRPVLEEMWDGAHSHAVSFQATGEPLTDYRAAQVFSGETEAADRALARLGGQDRAVGKLRFYLRLPSGLAPHKNMAVVVLGHCDSRVLAALREAARSRDRAVRRIAAAEMGLLCPSNDRATVDVLEQLKQDEDEGVRTMAEAALCSIRVAETPK